MGGCGSRSVVVATVRKGEPACCVWLKESDDKYPSLHSFDGVGDELKAMPIAMSDADFAYRTASGWNGGPVVRDKSFDVNCRPGESSTAASTEPLCVLCDVGVFRLVRIPFGRLCSTRKAFDERLDQLWRRAGGPEELSQEAPNVAAHSATKRRATVRGEGAPLMAIVNDGSRLMRTTADDGVEVELARLKQAVSVHVLPADLYSGDHSGTFWGPEVFRALVRLGERAHGLVPEPVPFEPPDQDDDHDKKDEDDGEVRA